MAIYLQVLKTTKQIMDELEIAAKLVASRLKTNYPFVLQHLEEFYERMDAWQKEYASPFGANELKVKFEKFRKAYPGIKRGLDVEYANFIKKHPKDAAMIVDSLLPALQREIGYHQTCQMTGKFCPEYQHLKTWINNRSWENVFPEPLIARATAPKPNAR